MSFSAGACIQECDVAGKMYFHRDVDSKGQPQQSIFQRRSESKNTINQSSFRALINLLTLTRLQQQLQESNDPAVSTCCSHTPLAHSLSLYTQTCCTTVCLLQLTAPLDVVIHWTLRNPPHRVRAMLPRLSYPRLCGVCETSHTADGQSTRLRSEWVERIERGRRWRG